MFCLIGIIILVFGYLLMQKDNQRQSKYLAITLLSYAAAVGSMILYLSKDTYYYNVVNNYFSLPKAVWKWLMFTRIPRDLIIRVLNLSSVFVIYFGTMFSYSYRNEGKRGRHNIKLGILLFLGGELILFDPKMQQYLYDTLYPNLLQVSEYRMLMAALHVVTVIINMAIILVGIVRLCIVYKRVYYLHFLRNYFIGEGVCYIVFMVSYMMMFWFSPCCLVKISKVAQYKTYLSVPLSDNQIIYTIYPYCLVGITAVCAFCIYEISVVKRKMKENSFSITKRIDAADTTSKVFCHYMKNELLAISSEIELLEVTEANKDGIEDLLKRCDNLYTRLDIIHRSTKQSELNLVETDLKALINDIFGRMKRDFISVELKIQMEEEVPKVMIDPNYFEQAIRNIIDNALDAMEGMPKERRKLLIGLQYISNWVILSISDCGVGISDKDMKEIFTPLYSSKPIKKHWGIGLALTHRIITAHDGKIEVESHENEGTTFRILLPDLKQYVS